MSSEKQKTYKVSIQWETEVKAKDYDEAILKGSDKWFFDYDQDHFQAEEQSIFIDPLQKINKNKLKLL